MFRLNASKLVFVFQECYIYLQPDNLNIDTIFSFKILAENTLQRIHIGEATANLFKPVWCRHLSFRVGMEIRVQILNYH